MYILGLSCHYHDSSAVLIKDGDIIAASNEERFSHIKHDFSFPENAIRFCLDYANIDSKDLDYVVFHEKPFIKFERILKTILATYPKSAKLFSDFSKNWLKEKLWIKSTITDFLDIPKEKVLFSQHHLSHAASSFFCSPFTEAAILTVDGVGEWATTTLGTGESSFAEDNKNNITLLKKTDFPHSIGLLYSVFTAFLGFKVNNGEYKVMGMSAYGEPKYQDKIYKLIDLNEDGSFKLNMKYFSYHYSTKYSFNRRFIKLFGEPRERERRFVLKKDDSSYSEEPIADKEIEENRYFADIAASIQKVTEDILIKIANHLHDITKLNKLCLAGGVSLNCVANSKILENTPFDEIYIQPAAGDSGAALGAALYVWHCLKNKKREHVLTNPYLGKEYTDEEIEVFLRDNDIDYKKYDNETELLDYIADAVIEQKIVGYFQGRFEWGPRALGNRSILADPRSSNMKKILNAKIKFREPFRPFAPSVLAEEASSFFDIDKISERSPLKFMLYTVAVKKRDLIPAVTHTNGMSRIQLLEEKDNPRYYSLIKNFYAKTGIPLLINTSFNLRGEPIVNSLKDVYSTFLRSGIDVLILKNNILEK
ncbi:MAG: carbamoyltransferase [Candidatus Kaelpia aquatica]|nr:carbamoyltransferase [Candidatus Kaelpia aquatica]